MERDVAVVDGSVAWFCRSADIGNVTTAAILLPYVLHSLLTCCCLWCWPSSGHSHKIHLWRNSSYMKLQ